MRSFFRQMILTAVAFGALAEVVVGLEPVPSGPLEASIPTAEPSSPTAAALSVLPAHVEPATSRPSSIPEPVSLAVFGTGLLLLLRRRRS